MDRNYKDKDFIAVNIRSYLEDDQNQKIGENELKNILSDFSSPKNKDVEDFLKNKAVDFANKHQSVTYLVYSKDTVEMVGYFTITMKPVTIKANGLSKTARKRLDRISRYDEKTDTYVVSAYLIAQFGKNYGDTVTDPISGIDLMDCTMDTLREIQYQLGGLLVYLECENQEKLLDFYQNQNGFRLFGERITEGTKEPHRLLQLMNFL